MKKILLISTGGTIASMPTDDGLTPKINSKKLLEYLILQNDRDRKSVV